MGERFLIVRVLLLLWIVTGAFFVASGRAGRSSVIPVFMEGVSAQVVGLVFIAMGFALWGYLNWVSKK